MQDDNNPNNINNSDNLSGSINSPPYQSPVSGSGQVDSPQLPNVSPQPVAGQQPAVQPSPALNQHGLNPAQVPNLGQAPNPAQVPNPNLGTPTVSPVTPGGGNSDFEKQKKIMIIVAVVVAVLIIVIATIVLLTRKTPESTVQIPQPISTLSKVEAINQLDEKHGRNRLKEEDMGFAKRNPEKPILHASFDESVAYFIDEEPEDWRYYKLDNVFNYTDVHGASSSDFAECDKFLNNNHDKLVTVVNIFKDNEFSYKQPKNADGRNVFHGQSPECYQGGLFVGEEYICSTRFDAVVTTDNSDGTSEVVPGIGVACSSVEHLKDDLEKAKISKQIAIDTGVPSDGPISMPSFVKDSLTVGYKIAEVAYAGGSGRYYKKGDYPWVDARSNLCTDLDTNIDAKLAFKGEKCSDGQGGGATIL